MHLTKSLALAILSSVAAVKADSCVFPPGFDLDTENTSYIFRATNNSCAGRGVFPDHGAEITSQTLTALGSSFAKSLEKPTPGQMHFHGCAVQSLKDNKYAQLNFTLTRDETFRITDLSSDHAKKLVAVSMRMWRAEDGPIYITSYGKHTGFDSPDHNRGDKKYPFGKIYIEAEKGDDPHRQEECPYL